MDGEVGISAHGRHRIVTEDTRLAMPETAIGYFPDVGAGWFLPRMPGEVGTWIGLTGLDINAPDAIFTGLADVQVPSFRLPDLLDAIVNMSLGSGTGTCDTLLRSFRSDIRPGPVEDNGHLIDRTLGFDTMRFRESPITLLRTPFGFCPSARPRA